MNKIKHNRYILPVLSGILFSAAFYSEYLSVAAWFCLVPLFISLHGKSPGESFKRGLIFGITANFAGQYWLVGTLTRFGGFPLIISILFILILCTYLAVQFSVFTYLCSKFKVLERRKAAASVLAAFLWVTLEYFFPQLFPYGIGNSQGLNTTLIQAVDLLGVHFISFVVVSVNVMIFRLYGNLISRQTYPVFEICFSALLLTFLSIYGIYKIDVEDRKIMQAPRKEAAIIQANFDFFEKTEDNQAEVTQKHKDMSAEIGHADLIIWPETAVQSWAPLDADYYAADGVPVVPDMEGTLFLIGGLSFRDRAEAVSRPEKLNVTKYNSAFLLNSRARILGRYHKVELLLFGEYLPFSNMFPFIKELSPASGDFTPGKELNLLENPDRDFRIGTLICYEDIIPYFSRKFTEKGANLLVNITNDAWFGRSVAPHQHLLVSIPRAVETRRFFVRATNTGVSAFIDSAGRVLYQSEIFEDTAVKKEIALLDGEPTFYVRAGEIFPYLCAFLSLLLVYYTHLGRKYI